MDDAEGIHFPGGGSGAPQCVVHNIHAVVCLFTTPFPLPVYVRKYE